MCKTHTRKALALTVLLTLSETLQLSTIHKLGKTLKVKNIKTIQRQWAEPYKRSFSIDMSLLFTLEHTEPS